MFALLSLRLHKGFEGFGSTAGRVKNEDEPQVRSERQIKEEQYINSKQNWLGFFFLVGEKKVLLTPLSTPFYTTLSTPENQRHDELLFPSVQ